MKKGFSLIELLIVLAIISTALGIGLSAFAASVRSSTKTTIYNKVKQNGDLVFETMTRSVRGAVDVCASGTTIRIYSTKVDCASPPLTIQTRFECTVNTGNGSITKDAVALTNQSGVRIKECSFTHSATTPKRVTIDFTLTQGVELGESADTNVEIPFRTEVTLRNF